MDFPDFETPKPATPLPVDLMFELLGYPDFKCVYVNEDGGVVNTAAPTAIKESGEVESND